MKILNLFIVAAVTALSCAAFGKGRGGPGKGPKHLLAFTGIVLASSTTQGGEGPSGSTLLTNTEYVYNWKWFGFGLYSQYDMQGTAQKDSAYGPKLEIRAGSKLFIELAHATAKRAFTDRNIAEQTGDGMIYGAGMRFAVGKAANKGWMFQATYKYRMLSIKKQDGVDLSDPIQQNDGYPTVGFGYAF